MLRAVEFDRHLLLGGFLERPARAWYGSRTWGCDLGRSGELRMPLTGSRLAIMCLWELQNRRRLLPSG